MAFMAPESLKSDKPPANSPQEVTTPRRPRGRPRKTPMKPEPVVPKRPRGHPRKHPVEHVYVKAQPTGPPRGRHPKLPQGTSDKASAKQSREPSHHSIPVRRNLWFSDPVRNNFGNRAVTDANNRPSPSIVDLTRAIPGTIRDPRGACCRQT